jgi:pimeloyl-ACP methyl ester carboxylesterase
VGVIAEGPYRYWDEPLHNMFRHRRYPRWPIIPLAGLWLRLTAKGFKNFDRAGHAARLACPLLVLHGSEDALCPITAAQQIAEAAPSGQFIEIEGGGHSDLPFGHEQAYRLAVGDFLKRLCTRGGSGTM